MAKQTASKVPQVRFKGFDGEWVEKTLGEVMAVGSVKRIHQSDWTKTGVRFLRARDIVSAYKNEDPADVLYISQSKYDKYSALSGKVEIGDLLVTGVGTIGVPYLIRKSDPVYFKDGNIIWFKNHGTLNGDFLYYSFIGKRIQNHIKESAGTGTVGTYTISSGKDTPLTSPRLEEQQKIGEYFRELDSLIGLHQRKHDKLVTLKKAMLQKMFPQPGATTPEIRFKGFSKPWEDKKLGDISSLQTGHPFEGKKFVDKGILLVRGMNVKRGYLDSSKGISEYWSSIAGFENFLLEEDDIVIQMDGALIGKSYAKIEKKNLPALLVQRVTRVRCVMVNCDFIYTYIQKGFLGYIRANKTETAVPHLSLNDIRDFFVALPCEAEQQKIGTYFRTLDELISKHAIQLQKLQQIKSACLEKMFV